MKVDMFLRIVGLSPNDMIKQPKMSNSSGVIAVPLAQPNILRRFLLSPLLSLGG
jgi:hypothetical protein